MAPCRDPARLDFSPIFDGMRTIVATIANESPQMQVKTSTSALFNGANWLAFANMQGASLGTQRLRYEVLIARDADRIFCC